MENNQNMMMSPMVATTLSPRDSSRDDESAPKQHSSSEVQKNYDTGGGTSIEMNTVRSSDLIATALDAANIGAQDAEVVSEVVQVTDGGVVDTGRHAIEEGIIFRNAATTATGNVVNPKVHFISNLTLVSNNNNGGNNKQQHQLHHHHSQSQTQPRNIIFVNNNVQANVVDGVSKPQVTVSQQHHHHHHHGYINAFVSKAGTVNTTTGKILMNVPKQQQQIVQQQKVMANKGGGGVQLLKRIPQQQIPGQNLVARTIATNSQLMQHQQKLGQALKQQNLVIGTAKMATTATAVATKVNLNQLKVYTATSMGNMGAAAVASTTPATVTMATTANGQKVVLGQQQQQQSLRYNKTATILNQGTIPKGVKAGGGITSVTAAGIHKVIPKVVQIQNRIGEMTSGSNKLMAGGGKYNVVQQQQQQNLKMNTITSVHYQQQGGSSVQQHNLAGIQTGGAIKYVNAQGNVVQHLPVMKYQKQHSQPIALPQQDQNGQPDKHQQDPVSSSSNNNNNNVIQYGTSNPSTVSTGTKKKQQHSSSGAPATVLEDVYYVNGTQMNDEMSARILQSLSQKPQPAPMMNRIMTQTQQQPGPPKYQYVVAAAQPQTASSGVGYEVAATALQSSPVNNVQGSSGVHQMKHGPEYFRVNTSDIHHHAATTTTYIDNIPLTSARIDDYGVGGPATATVVRDPNNNNSNNNSAIVPLTLAHHHHQNPQQYVHQQQHHLLVQQQLQSADMDQDDVVGIEVRPVPVTGGDERLKALHAILQDHTYVMQNHTQGSTAHHQQQQQQQQQQLLLQQQHLQPMMSTTIISYQQQQSHQALVPGDSNSLHYAHQQVPLTQSYVHMQQQQLQQQQPIKCTTNDLLNAAIGLGGYNNHDDGEKDEDNQSVISNDSMKGGRMKSGGGAGSHNSSGHGVGGGGLFMDNEDQGEETETAPEGEGEDDSVTRCICDLTHDDGYMICCDKCSTWQHVDCMGIDRMNIPDEYNCDLCQPRPVDKNRARTLQLLKRREQQSFLTSTLQGANQQLGGAFGAGAAAHMTPFEQQQQNGNMLLEGGSAKMSPIKKQKTNATSMRRKGSIAMSDDGSGSYSVKKQHKQQRDQYLKGMARVLQAAKVAGKRKEKKQLTKRKGGGSQSKSASAAAAATSSQQQQGQTTTDDKQLLRMWIENYEKAMTNHYSPELRARMQAIGKQQQQQQMPQKLYGLNLKNVGDGKCLTVPHAGGKILISTDDTAPNVPIVELRGKYMLSGQYRQQNNGGGGGGLLGHGRNNNQSLRIPGPFIFFYRLQSEGTEVCVDTRTYGNEARFVRRSCRPNAEIVHHIEKGIIHLYVVSLLQIKSSTEITIKHEPHDLLAITAAKANLTISGGVELLGGGSNPQPTSTACACGLVKDCLFYNANATANIGLPVVMDNQKPKRLNGHVQKPRQAKEPEYQRRMYKANVRTSRSTSSSGESSSAGMLSPNINVSTIGLMSPPIQQQQQHPQQQSQINLMPTTNPLIANGLVPKEEPKLNVPKVEVVEKLPTATTTTPTPTAIESLPPLDTEQELESSAIPTTTTPEVVKVEKIKEEETVVEKVPPALADVTSVPSVTMAEPPAPVKKEEETMISSCDAVADGSNPMAITTTVASTEATITATTTIAAQSTVMKKNKELKSLGEENLKAGPGISDERKLTREERKMAAIMKAFEKMEKSSQRKQQELNRKTSESGSGTSSRRRDSNTSGGGGRKDSSGDDRSVGPPFGAMLPNKRKRQRKASKSYQQNSHRKSRRSRSRVNSHDSDPFTSEDSATSLKASPPISVPYTAYNQHPLIPGRQLFETCAFNRTEPSSTAMNHHENSAAARMLLSLANVATATSTTTGLSPSTPSQHNAIESPMSSAFMLVEAAIAPLETAAAAAAAASSVTSSDFKMPKTKKSIMNDWLLDNEKEQLAGEGDQPQNLCKKVEEFINIEQQGMVSGGSVSGEADVLTVPPSLPTPPLAGGSESAVKKRWLRQAISEECSDEAPASPTNGYFSATPLKKRRFALHSTGDDDLSHPSTAAKLPMLGEAAGECDEKMEKEANERKPDQSVVKELKTEEKDCIISKEVVTEEEPRRVADGETDIGSVKVENDDDQVKIKEEECDKMKVEQEDSITVDAQQVMETADTVSMPLEKEDESAEEEAVCKDEHSAQIVSDGFDIEPLHPHELDVKENERAAPSVTVAEPTAGPSKRLDDTPDEMEDLQKRIHSFHAENILFLKSLNKKTKPNPLSADGTPHNNESMSAYSSASVSVASSSAASSRASSPVAVSPKLLSSGSKNRRLSTAKQKRLDFGDIGEEEVENANAPLNDEKKNDEPTVVDAKTKAKRRKTRFSSPIPEPQLVELNSTTTVSVADHMVSMGASPVIPVLNMSSTFKSPDVAATLPFFAQAQVAAGGLQPLPSQHLTSISAAAAIPQLGINTAVPPPQLPFNAMFTGKFGTTAIPQVDLLEQQQSSSRLLLSELLENAQIMNHHGFGVADPMHSQLQTTQTPSFNTLLEPRLLPQLTTSASNQGYFTTLNAAVTSKLPAAIDGQQQSTARTGAFPRTATADPRLNPNLNAIPEPPPAPKRKLSINEYRKRMQQTSCTGSNSSSGATSPTRSNSYSGGGGSGSASNDGEGMSGRGDDLIHPELLTESKILDSLNELKDDSNSCDDSPKTTREGENVLFSAAPTLLELQQESISERLKSYKSVTELLTSKEGTPMTNILQSNLIGSSIIESLRTTPNEPATPDDTSVVVVVASMNPEDQQLQLPPPDETNNNDAIVDKMVGEHVTTGMAATVTETTSMATNPASVALSPSCIER